MRVEGTYRYPHPQEHVYRTLLDPVALKACLPGCESLELIGPDHYAAVLKVGVAAVRGTYRGEVLLSDQDSPNAYRMAVSGKGGPGIVNGQATISLSTDDPNTVVTVVGEGKLAGPIAGLAQRLVQGIAGSMMNRFFDCLGKQLGPGAA